MKEMKRILSFVLCFAMFVGMLPMFALNADAAGDTHYLMFATDRHVNTSVIGNIINNMESVIGENKLEYLALGGDMVGSGDNHPAYDSSEVLAEAMAATSSLNAENVDIVAGIHDMKVNDDAGIVLPYQGGGAQIFEGEDYYVYGVEEYCISEDSNESNWAAQAEAFEKWALSDDVDPTKVIFVVSHYPLHAKRNDNDGAMYWHWALNYVATGSSDGDGTVERDIVFFHGHNHTKDTNEYVYNVGDKMSVQNGNSTVSGTIYYTYATAGYLNQNKKATLVTLTDDAIVLTKYSTSGSGIAMTTVERVVTETAPVETTTPAETTPVVADIKVVSNKEVYCVDDELDITVYAVYTDGSEVAVEDYEVSDFDSAVTGTQTVVVTYGEFSASLKVKVVEQDAEPVLTGIQVTYSKETLLGEALVLKVVATYDNGDTLELTADQYTITGYDPAATGAQGVVVTYETVSYGFNVINSNDVTVLADGMNSLTVTDVTETMAELVAEELEEGFLAYDITLDGYNVEKNVAVVSMPAPEGANAVFHWNAQTNALEPVTNVTFADGYVTFTTDHFSTYVVGEVVPNTNWVTIRVPGEYTVYKYTQVDTVASGNAYVIVGYGSSAALNVDKSVQTVNVNGTEITSTEELDLWTFTAATNGYTINNNGTYLMYQNGLSTGGTQADWFVTNESGLFQAYLSVGSYGNRYLYTNGTSWAMGQTSDGLSLYAYSGTGTEYADDGLFARMDGTTAYTVPVGTSIYNVEQVIKEGITVYTTTDTSTEGTAISDSDYTLTTDYTNNSGEGAYTVSVVYNELVLGTVTLTVAGIPESEDAEGSGEITTTTTKTVYVLTSSISSGNSYLIANSNSASTTTRYLLARNGSSVAATGVTIKSGDVDGDGDTETYIELDDATDELWTVSNSYRFQNGGYYLRYNSGLVLDDDNYTTWSYSSNRLYYSSGRTTYYLRYSNDWTTTDRQNSATSIYFYMPTEIEVETTTTVSGTYSIEGEDQTVVVSEEVMDIILTAELTFTSEGGVAGEPEVVDATYTVYSDPSSIVQSIEEGVLTFTGNYGTAVIKVSYTTDFGDVTDYFTVTATAPYYGIQLYEKNAADELVLIEAPVALKGIEAGDTYAVWAVVKEYDGITDDEGEDGEDLGDVEDDRLYWAVSDPSIATIDPSTGLLIFTGNNYGTFQVTVYYLDEDGDILCEDTITISATKSQYVVPGDGTNDFPEYPNEGAVRFDKTATAVGNFSETGIAKVELSMTGVPYTTGSEMDVVLMLDQSTSMDDNRIAATVAATKAFIQAIVINEDGTYNKNRIYVGYFNGGNVVDITDSANIGGDLASIDSKAELDALFEDIDDEFDGSPSTTGTNYAVSLKKCHDRLNSAKVDEIGKDRQQFCVFMSDGVPTCYQYDEDSYYGATSGNDNASQIYAMFTGTYFNTRDNDYLYEYYSTEMKKAGVTVYTVGLGLNAKNSAWGDTYGQAAYCVNASSILLNDISGPANEASQPDAVGTTTTSKKDSYFFSVEDANAATEMAKVFENIAQKILEAATNIEVEDKIGNNYSMNFSIPGYGTDNAVSSDALDGTTEFYIQVVEYQLNADKERTGEPTVLENFTFNANGTLKSHTVDGVACSNCDHVTTGNGAITAIDGTYFDYKSDSTGEYLNWTADKLTTTELALQYFAHLDNSTGVTAADQIDAGTYYTNEYATLTYDNYKGERVQQEFPVPQMTWNGAQVHYVFYLVNEKGQPVNTAGRVVPFAEAVYVTDVYHYEVVWNDLEQTTGLSANYLAEQLVPEVYELYDDDATYELHVYEDENEVNLNNHFIIGGDVTDEYNPSWTNAKTTYVFNTKADGTKYNVVGTYIANDGSDSTTSTSYLCKSAAIEGATYETSVDVGGNTIYTVTSVGNGYQAVAGETQVPVSEMKSTTGGTVINGYVYYVDDNGVVYTIVRKTNGTEVREGFDFSNTTVAFAVVWKPQLKEDTVVVDYGLDVLVDVTTNDTMAAGVVGVRTTAPDATINSGTYTRDKDATKTSVDVMLNNLKIGTASVESLKTIRFSLDKTNGMQFTESVSFFYESDVNFYNSGNTLVQSSMYSKVTVIPATTVYYEDDFMTFSSYSRGDGSWPQDETSKWATKAQNGTQAQDRPGASKISAALDADNNYGYDAAYEKLSTYSLNSAAQITVDADTRGEATFTFWGTGFDVIGLTNSSTGAITVLVKDADGKTVKNTLVDTYYGMDADGNVDLNNPDALYQVPVIKIYGLGYGKYTVKITAGYNAIFDHEAGSTSYDLYLDAIRIYNPTGNQDETANDAYKADGEAYPRYETIRDKVIAASNFTVTEDPETGKITVTAAEGATDLTGPIFIDCNDGTTSIAEYVSFGPNNELYLANNQAIAFNVATTATVADVQLGIKIAGGGSVTYEINGDTYTVNTATDLYYSILEYAKDGVVTIKNVSGGILSLTNIKVTYTQDPGTTTSLMSMDAESAGIALMSLRRAPVVEEPETTEPETTEPETTEPETTEPETTEPEETKPESSSREEKLIKVIGKIIRGILGRIFG